MSHNILTVNTNNFDVNSNQSLTVSPTDIDVYFLRGDTGQLFGYPRTPVVGDNYVFYQGYVVNQMSGLTVNTLTLSGRTWVESFTLANNGTYRFTANPFNATSTSAANPSVGYYWYDVTNSNIISNSCWWHDSQSDYVFTQLISGVVEVSGSSVTIAVRIYAANNTDVGSNFTAPNFVNVMIEKLK